MNTYPIVGAPSDPPAQVAPQRPLACVLARVVQVLSLSGESSVAHSVEAYRDGLRVTLNRNEPLAPIYAYALPWARGWTVFVSDDDAATNRDWHNCEGYSQRVSNPRNVNGPENVNADLLANAFVDAIDYLEYHFTDRPVEDENEDDYFDGEDGDSGDCVFYGQP